MIHFKFNGEQGLVEWVARSLVASLGSSGGYERAPDHWIIPGNAETARVICEQAARAAITAINASGTHVVAPVVATEEMKIADSLVSIVHHDPCVDPTKPDTVEAAEIWSAMLAAAREGK